jgi:ribosomal protein S18 acetylase RimI-like enzyme
VHEDPELTWIATPAPNRFYNGVVHTRLSETGADAAIGSVAEHFRRHNWLLAWWVMPNSRPGDLAKRLSARAFAPWTTDLGMAADLGSLADSATPPSGVTVERVRTDTDLGDWLRAFGRGFGLSDAVVARYAQLPRGVPPAQSLFRFYVARAGAAPVGSAFWFPAPDAALIDEVATIPEMRRRGVATALTHAALQDAKAEGYRTAVLVASEAGKGVYRRLGFHSYGRREVYLENRPQLS